VSRHDAAILEKLDEAECMRLVSTAAVGRLAFVGQYDLTVLPVNFTVADGAILFRTTQDGLTDADLSTGITGADYKVAFEVDHLEEATHEGWSVLIQGPAHRLDADAGQAAARTAGVQPWAGGEKSQFVRITPVRVTGRRIRHSL
jgi:nitroimidazol reductase NimA-like FMN-containing flavoprotein (pyridoxamine 5'-phosphate oxidase superfamily)